MADIEPLMVGGYLRRADADDVLICEAFRLAQSTATSIRSIKTPLADKFEQSIELDKNGNFIANFTFRR